MWCVQWIHQTQLIIGNGGPVQNRMEINISLCCIPGTSKRVGIGLFNIVMQLQQLQGAVQGTYHLSLSLDSADWPGCPGQSRSPCTHAIFMRLPTNKEVQEDTFTHDYVKRCLHKWMLLFVPFCTVVRQWPLCAFCCLIYNYYMWDSQLIAPLVDEMGKTDFPNLGSTSVNITTLFVHSVWALLPRVPSKVHILSDIIVIFL